MEPYVIRQGDSLATLSARFGFDADRVWNDPANRDLRKLRGDPNVLAPCDIVYLPEPKPNCWPLNGGEMNRFVVNVPTLHARIQCIDASGAALGGVPYEIPTLDPPVTGQTAADGTIDLEIPQGEDIVRIHFPGARLDLVAHVGHLDPPTDPSGATQRLSALNVEPRMPVVLDPDVREIVEDECLAEALGRFQSDQGVDVTYALDDPTRDALVRAHGA